MQVGKYQLVTKLATGGMAEVFLAKAAGPMGFEKTLVLKRILPHMSEDPAFVDMFLGEAKLAAQLNHPNIVQIFDFGEAEGSYYLAMEYIDGPNLRTLAKRVRQSGESMPAALSAKIIASACEGLAFAHSFCDPETGEPLGLIHRDISPDNIMVSRQGAVKVVDFGIAKAAGQANRTQTGVVKGKLSYMPPEQLQAKGLDLRVDVYALGVVLYEMLTGQKPFDATTDVSIMQAILFEPLIPVEQRRPDLPEALQQVLARALAKNRDERYPDCHALHADLERFVMSTGEPVGAYQISQLVKRASGEAVGAVPTPPPGSGSGARKASSNPQQRVPTGSGQMAAPQDSRPGLRPNANVPVDETRPTTRERLVPGGGAPAAPPPFAREETSASGQVKSRARITGADLQEPVGDLDARDTVMDQSALAPESRGRPRWLLPAVAGSVVLLAAGGAFVALRPSPQPARPIPEAAPEAAPVQAGVVKGVPLENVKIAATPAPEPVVKPTPPEPVAAPPPETQAQAPAPAPEKAPEPVAPEPVKPKPTLASKRTRPAVTTKSTASKGGMGTVEFRIRPYATVFIDGKSIGQTPFAPIQVPEGRHSVTLVNRDLDKEVTKVLSVEANKSNIFKYNLLEE